ncbi:unnamed protein product [marine sediment metagenome]|uniref:Uncharacterized protein n=1 Tax=marine sediment metagenome TaxID=412755 RepID=X0UYV0_9ZZZZ
MRYQCSNSFTLTNPYSRVEEPFYLPSQIRDNRNKEAKTRLKNRKERKRKNRAKS